MDGFLATSMKISPKVHKVFDRVLSEFSPACLRVFLRVTVLRQELSRLSTASVCLVSILLSLTQRLLRHVLRSFHLHII